MKVPMYCFPKEYEMHRRQYIAAFDRVCSTGYFAGGEFVKEFEKDFSSYLGISYAVGLNSCTDALQASLLALGIGKGDEVIVPSATFTATPGAVLMCGAKPVFAECEKDTWQISADSVSELINKNTKAVIGVHLYGGVFDIGKLLEITHSAGIPLIEDAAQSFGSKYRGRYTGTFGETGCFSFYPTKNLGAFGNAGCVVCENEELTAKIIRIKEHDMRGDRYELPGFNMMMDGVQAEILREKLKMSGSFIKRKREIAGIYSGAIGCNPMLGCQSNLPETENTYHLFVVKSDDREKFRAYMLSRGIETGVQYGVPCHLQKVFEPYCEKQQLPVTEELFEKCVSVPVYPYMTDEEVAYVADALINYGK